MNHPPVKGFYVTELATVRSVMRKDLDSMGLIPTGVGIALVADGDHSLLYGLVCEAIYVRIFNGRDREDVSQYANYLANSLGIEKGLGARFIQTALRVHRVLSCFGGNHNSAYKELMQDKGADSATVKAVITACVQTAKEFSVAWDKNFDHIEQQEMSGDVSENGALGIVSAFLMIAGADGDIDQKEFVCFSKSLMKHSKNAQIGGLLSSVAENIIPYTSEIVKGGVGLERLVSIMTLGCRSVLESRGATSLKHYKMVITDMVEDVASASGGFLGFGKKIDKNEAAAIEGIKKILSQIK